MPDLEWNRKRWGETHDWSRGGDEWSDGAGGPVRQWFWWLYPRVHAYLPAQTVLEIAPGYGRWTQFLVGQSQRLIGVDIAQRCVDACRDRFPSPGCSFHVNDGYSVPMVEDHSVDFAFSFGSLIHAESDVMDAYVAELARTLKPDGVAFLHHSNALDCGYGAQPPRSHAATVSATSVARAAEEAGLLPIVQEVFSWGTPVEEPISCFSVLTPQGSAFAKPAICFQNERVDADIAYIDRLSAHYES